jgi:DMSO/TMAO reductase YedYZ heme-binding membrane subunit
MQKSEKKYWNKLYVIVFLFLVLQIIFYYFVTKYFQ